MPCLATAGKHFNNIQAIAKQPPITIEKLLETVFSVGSAPRLYNEDLRLVERAELRDIRRTVTT
jgi:hypothetical protein